MAQAMKANNGVEYSDAIKHQNSHCISKPSIFKKAKNDLFTDSQSFAIEKKFYEHSQYKVQGGSNG